MTRKIFRFFKHKNAVNSIYGGIQKLGELLKKYEQTKRHDYDIKKQFFGSSSDVRRLEGTRDQNEYEEDPHIIKETPLTDVVPEESELRIIKSPRFLDSKVQLSLRILHQILGILADLFGLAYYFMDHMSFLGRIDVITNPKTKKVKTIPHNQRFVEL